MHTEMSALTESASANGSPRPAAGPVQSAQRPAQPHSGAAEHPAERLTALRAALREAAAEAEEAALSERTRALYAADWARFTGWCERIGVCALPAEEDTIAMFVMDMAMTTTKKGEQAFKVASIERHLSAIARF